MNLIYSGRKQISGCPEPEVEKLSAKCLEGTFRNVVNVLHLDGHMVTRGFLFVKSHLH